MPVAFELPDVGEGLAEAEVVDWLVGPGDAVAEDQPVAEVETDKAVVEVPSPVTGTVLELRAEPGDVVPVGEVLVVFDPDEPGSAESREAVDEPPTASADPGNADGDAADGDGGGTRGDEVGADGTGTGSRTFAPPRVRRVARELDVDIAAVSGSGTGGRVTEADVRAAAETAGDPSGRSVETETDAAGADETVEADSSGRTVDANGATAAVSTGAADRDRTAAVPATRGVARDLGVDIDAVPTDEERKGYPFVSADQVRQYASREQAREAAPDAAAGGTGDRVERVPYRGLRRTVGERMAESKFTVPHVSAFHNPDVTALVEARERLRPAAAEQGVELTYLPFVMKATVSALEAFPRFNAELDEDAGELVLKQYYDIGVATATEDGLLVPVVEAVDEKGILELAREVGDLAARARDRSLSPSELRGGTFTISNFGAIGGEYATPIVNYPETGILGLGTVEQRPRVVDGEVVPRYTMPLSVSFDHRVADGLDGGRFATHLVERLADPKRLLL